MNTPLSAPAWAHPSYQTARRRSSPPTPAFDADGRPIHPIPPADHQAHTLAAALVAAFKEDRANDPNVLLDPAAADQLWRRYTTAAKLLEPEFGVWIIGRLSKAEAAIFGIGGAR